MLSIPTTNIKELTLKLNLIDDITIGNQNQERGPKKIKQIKEIRKPYRTYKTGTTNTTDIYVGKQASDNDILTITSKKQTPNSWWFHVKGNSGSHVVLNNPSNYKSINPIELKDAACLAARHSKSYTSGISKIYVTVTRCSDVIKPPFVNDGMVLLKRVEDTVFVDVRGEEERFKRLDGNVCIN